MNKALELLGRHFQPSIHASGVERLRVCLGVSIGIFLTGAISHWLLGPTSSLPMLIAPMGASAVLLFAMPSSPLAQPWPLIGGNVISALVGIACAKWIAHPILAAMCAVAGAIAAMFALRCLHPPGGAIALLAVVGGAAIKARGFQFALTPVALNSILMVTAAFLFNNLTRHRYPHVTQQKSAEAHPLKGAPPSNALGFTEEDVDDAIKHHDEVLDVSRDDLSSLFLQAEMHAFRRRFGAVSCADIMSRDFATVSSEATIAEAWVLLTKSKIKALPVIDDARRVIGIVTVADFMKHSKLSPSRTEGGEVERLDGLHDEAQLDEPTIVEHVMTKKVFTAYVDAHIVELVPMLTELGFHQVPIVDRNQQLAGLVTQSDLIAALYRGQLAAAKAA